MRTWVVAVTCLVAAVQAPAHQAGTSDQAHRAAGRSGDASLATERGDGGVRRPMQAGDQPRPTGWNSDGAPRPPRMWRGYGAAWPSHYRACRRRYPSYDYRTDTYRKHGSTRSRCVI
jgi:hypothetical protein